MIIPGGAFPGRNRGRHNLGPIIGAVAGILILVLVIYLATRPPTFTVTRTGMIDAPPARVYPLIADFRNWDAWSPWDKRDPNMKRTYGGAGSGTGATYAWDGNKNVGEGRMEITGAVEPSRIDIALDFIKPFKASNTTEFRLEPSGSGTRVVWSMTGKNNLMSRVMGIFMNFDKMIGKDFEAGLAAMKKAAES